MKVKESIKLLEKQGFKVYSNINPDQWNNPLYSVWLNESHYGVYTTRELIKFCDSRAKTPRSKGLQFMKKHSHKRQRTKQNNLIKVENFDKIPEKDCFKREFGSDWD